MKTQKTSNKAFSVLEYIQLRLPQILDSHLLSRWSECPENIIAARLGETLNLVPNCNGNVLLNLIDTVPIPALKEFIVKKQLASERSRKKEPWKVYYSGNNFSAWFQNKVEAPQAATSLQYFVLGKHENPSDESIVATLKKISRVETTLAEVCYLLEQQPKGEKGKLSNEGPNLFYIRDIQQIIRTVKVQWFDYWHITAFSIPGPYARYHRERIFVGQAANSK